MEDWAADDFYYEPYESERQVTFSNEFNQNYYNTTDQYHNFIKSCEICKEVFTNQMQYARHLNTSRHRNKKRANKVKMQVSDPGDMKTWQKIDDPQKKFQEIAQKTPVVGLEYVTEYYDYKNQCIKAMVCAICQVHTLFLQHMMDHVTGFKHRLQYLQIHYPARYKEVIGSYKCLDNREIKHEILSICRELGFQNPSYQIEIVEIISATKYIPLDEKNKKVATKKVKELIMDNKAAHKKALEDARKNAQQEQNSSSSNYLEKQEGKGNEAPNKEKASDNMPLVEDKNILRFLLEDAKRSGIKKTEEVIEWMQPSSRKSLYLLICQRKRFNQSVVRLRKLVGSGEMTPAELSIEQKLQSALFKVKADIQEILLSNLNAFNKGQSTSETSKEIPDGQKQNHTDENSMVESGSSTKNSDPIFKNPDELNSLRDNLLMIKNGFQLENETCVVEYTNSTGMDETGPSTSNDEASTSFYQAHLEKLASSKKDNSIKLKDYAKSDPTKADSEDLLTQDARAFMEEKIFKALCEGSLAPIAKAFADNPTLQAALKKWESKQPAIPSEPTEEVKTIKQECVDLSEDKSVSVDHVKVEPESNIEAEKFPDNVETDKGNITPPSFFQSFAETNFNPINTPHSEVPSTVSANIVENNNTKVKDNYNSVPKSSAPKKKNVLFKKQQPKQFNQKSIKQRPQANSFNSYYHNHNYYHHGSEFSASHEQPVSLRKPYHKIRERPLLSHEAKYRFKEQSLLVRKSYPSTYNSQAHHDILDSYDEYHDILTHNEYDDLHLEHNHDRLEHLNFDKTHELYGQYPYEHYEDEILAEHSQDLIHVRRPLLQDKDRGPLLSRPSALLGTPRKMSTLSHLQTLDEERQFQHLVNHPRPRIPYTQEDRLYSLHTARRFSSSSSALLGKRPMGSSLLARPKYPRM